MSDIFQRALKYLSVNEGGFDNHPADRGGATKYGITRGDLSKWLKRSVSVDEVRNMTYDTASSIYRAWYWDSLSLDLVKNEAIAIALFDMGVLRGIGWPIKQAQTICNNLRVAPSLTVDNHMGPKTAEALNSVNTRDFIEAYEGVCEAGFRSIVARNSSQKVFLRGWLNRSKRLLTLIPKSITSTWTEDDV